MSKKPAEQPATIDDILTQFFSLYLDGKTGVTRRRIDDAQSQLRACIESEAMRILVTDDRLVLQAELQFNPDRAVARLMHAEDLLYLLAIFTEPQWQPSDRTQRAAQLQLTDRLTTFLVSRNLVDRRDYACPILEVQVAIDRGRAEVRRQRAAAREL
jgi:hypothetical protein